MAEWSPGGQNCSPEWLQPSWGGGPETDCASRHPHPKLWAPRSCSGDMVQPHLQGNPEAQHVSVSCPRTPDEQGTELDLPPRPHASTPVLSDPRSPSPGAARVALRENSSLEQDLPPLCAWSSQCCVSSPVRGLKA